MKQRFTHAALVIFFAVLFNGLVLPCAARGETAQTGIAAAAAPGGKPLVVWYSRTGTAQLVAETLQKQLGCDISPIPSTKDRSIFSIVNEQLLGGEDEQQKFPRDLSLYNPVIIAEPIYFMKLSAPGRAFMELNREALKGKDLYLFVTLGGKLADGKIQAIKEYGAGLGLNIKEVFFMQTGKKDEFPKRIRELLKVSSLQVSTAR
jgi:flavodoxin